MAQENVGINITVGGNTDQALGSLKSQLREATAEVTRLSEQFGASSKEAVQAAKRAAELKDQIGDAKSLIDAFNPDAKFKALTASLGGVAGGFSALQGATALFGKENEAVEKTLLKVQSAMALSQGLQAVGESIDSFKQLGIVIKTQVVGAFSTLRGAIIATGVGALAIAIGLVIANFDKVKKAILNTFPGFGKLTSFIGNTINAFTDLIGITNAATRAEQQRQAIYNKASAGTKIVNEGIQRQIKLLQAQGAEQGKIDALRKQSIQNELNDLKKLADTKGILRGEDAKKYKDLQNDLQVIDATAQKQREDAAKQAAERGAAAANKYGESAKKKADQELEEYNERIDKQLEEEKKLTEELLSEYDKRRKDRLKVVTFTQEELRALDKAEAEENKKKQEAIDNERFAGQKAVMASTKNFVLQGIQEQQKAAEIERQIEKQKTDDKLKELELQKQGAMAALDAVASIIDQNSVAGKAIAVAKAIMSTYEGATKALGAYPPPFGAIAAAATVAAGLANVKRIVSTNIPSARGTGNVGGGASAPSINSAAPIAPAQPEPATTNISTQSINALGNQAIRTYVVESDVTSNQQRIAAIQQRARFG